MDRLEQLDYMKQILDYVDDCRQVWEVAHESARPFLAFSIRRGLQDAHRICQSFKQESSRRWPTSGGMETYS